MDELSLMGRIYTARRRRAGELLKAFGITLNQHDLVRLARRRGSLTPSAAAKELLCDRPTLTLVAQKCVAQDWLGRRRSEADRRSTRLKLTGAGEELLDRIESSRILGPTALGDPLEELSGEERAVLRSMLERVWRRACELYGDVLT